MKKAVSLLFWLLTLATLASHVQAQGVAFSCDGTFYQIRQVGTTSSLFRVDRSAAAYNTVPVNVRTLAGGTQTNDLGILLNGLAYNSQDGFMYALSTTGTSATLPTSIQMYKIGQGGITSMGTVTGIPNIQVASGTIDKSGRYYVSSQNSAGTSDYNLYMFNLATATPLAAITLRLRNETNTADTNLTFYDLALNPKDGLLYGVLNTGTLWRIDPTTNASTSQAPVKVISATASAGSSPVGTAFFDIAGNMFVYSNGATATANSGKFYQVDITSGAYNLISSIDPATVSDGASCINPSFFVDVVKEVTDVVRNSAISYTTYFHFRVKNTGTQTLERVQVSDFLWSGASGTTQEGTTFSSMSTTLPTSVTVSGLTVINDGNATLAANNIGTSAFTGVSSSTTPIQAGMLTGTQNLTAGQSATINFSVTAVYPAAANVPTTVLNNQAYASALGGATTANAGYRLGATGGTLFSPANGNLQAIDASTNSAALPNTPNGDAASPSPIYYQTAILGNVFEDVNYGGGAGRTQRVSNGTGVNLARVELYTALTGAFAGSTTTDAAGNYSFVNGENGITLTTSTNYRIRVVNSTVVSNHPGSVSGLLPVQTYLNGDVNRVGGENPNQVDEGANSGTQSLAALELVSTSATIETITPVGTGTGSVNTPANGPLVGVDFGFNFDVVVNTNDVGQGSLRQFILNSNALTNANLDQAVFNGAAANGVIAIDPTAGVERAVFMLNDGRATDAPAGLRTGTTASMGYDNTTKQFTITLATGLANITDNNTSIDGSVQTVATGNNATATPGTTTGPKIVINFNNQKGLFVTGGNTRIASVGLNNAKGSVGIASPPTYSDGAAVTFSGANVTGSVVNDVTATGNATAAIRLQSSNNTAATNNATGVTISNNVFRAGGSNGTVYSDGINLVGASGNTISGNTISGNPGWGILLATNTNDGNTISGNTITGNGTANNSEKAGLSIQVGSNNLISTNTISNNSGDGIVALTGTLGNRFTQNSVSTNGNLGIDLSANSTATGDGVTLNSDGKTNASGANGLLNFPVFTQATINNGTLFITGFSKAGALIEIFLASANTSKFGEGATYYFSATEGSSADGDPRYGNYTSTTGIPAGSPPQGSQTGANQFRFSFPVTAAQITSLAGNSITATATVPSTVNGLAIGNTSEFSAIIAVVNNKPLPVELTTFDVKAAAQNAQLSWSTASEKNNDRFVVERSLNGTTFEAIGNVKGSGSSAQAHSYGFVDAGIGARHSGLMYYRLQQVDTDGKVDYGPVRSLTFAAKLAGMDQLALYPNPTTATTTLDLTALTAGTYHVTVLDAVGRTISSGSYAGGMAHPLDVQRTQPGTYLVFVRGQGVKITKTLVKE